MKYKLVLLLLGICSFYNCISPSQKNNGIQLYEKAQENAKAIQPDSLLNKLRKAFETGFKNPMQIVTDTHFYDLIDNPIYRPKVRELLQQFATGHQAKMVREDEPGEPIIIHGKIVNETTNKPIKAVKVELMQTDQQGFYFHEKSTWNPRIFAYLTTTEEGSFRIHTIKPGQYLDDNGNNVPAHIHFSLHKKGFKPYGSEFTFEDDSTWVMGDNLEQIPVAKWIQGTKPKTYQVIIPMQKE